MERQNIRVIFHDRVFPADIKDGELISWQPITLRELNDDITKCISYLEDIKRAMEETNLVAPT